MAGVRAIALAIASVMGVAATGPACAELAVTVPALTPVKLELLAALGSKESRAGDRFPLRLAAPLVIDGREIAPVGTEGVGEVVHAKKRGGSGTPGELVLAARYLDVGGRRLRLRSLRLGVTGASNITRVNALNVASAATLLPIGLIGFAVKGGEATVAPGTIADARTAEDFVVDAASATGSTGEGSKP